jgi:Raf kinase inhibitor-like YbhB/YbcL family protein
MKKFSHLAIVVLALGAGMAAQTPAELKLTSAAFTEGGAIPVRHAQAGEEVSPPLAWDNPPNGTASFVLLVHDLDATSGQNAETTLHWLVWNIPASARSLPAAVPQGPEQRGGMRQISVTGPNYRGPAQPPAGPSHRYAFELYALDITLEVPPVGARPAQTRAAVVAAMAGHVLAKGTLTGRFPAAQPIAVPHAFR